MMKEARLHNIEKHALQQMVLGKWDNTMLEKKKRRKLNHSLTLTKISSKWIKALTVRPGTIKLPEGNINRTLSYKSKQ